MNTSSQLYTALCRELEAFPQIKKAYDLNMVEGGRDNTIIYKTSKLPDFDGKLIKLRYSVEALNGYRAIFFAFHSYDGQSHNFCGYVEAFEISNFDSLDVPRVKSILDKYINLMHARAVSDYLKGAERRAAHKAKEDIFAAQWVQSPPTSTEVHELINHLDDLLGGANHG